MICPICGFEFPDDSQNCPVCGTPLEEQSQADNALDGAPDDAPSEEETENLIFPDEEASNARSRNYPLFIILIILLLAGCGVIGYFVVYPLVQENEEQEETERKAEIEKKEETKKKESDKKEAQKVIDLINTLKDKEITKNSENELEMIRLHYNSLSQEQKRLVTNHDTLEEAFKTLQVKKDEAAANEVITAINAVNITYLTAEDTSIQELRKKYESLTESQKQLVTNSNKIAEYEQIVQTRRQQQAEAQERSRQMEEQKKKISSLIWTFSGYYGRWGDFGKHMNQYQGMIETAIKEEGSYRNHFMESPNDLLISISGFQWDGQNIYTAKCDVYFEGTLKNTGQYGALSGTVLVNSNGALEFILNSVYPFEW